MQIRTLNGRYRLDEPIGEGGMAIVYRGYDLVLDRSVAIKVLRDQYGSDANFLARFQREAQAAARLSHPHIVNVYDVGQDGNSHYIVMEFINGPNLKDLIRRQGPFSVEGAAFILRQVASALDYAHERGLVHRDIKPQNILVDENGNAKVVDLGIAKGQSDTNLTEAGTGMGTVHYVSPEQARGEAATPASDVYATGVVLYEMLTKQVPFDADTPVGVAMQHVTVDPPPPSQFNSAISPQVEEVVLRGLAKDPRERFQTVSDLASALRNRQAYPTASEATRAMPGVTGAARPERARPPASGGRGGRNVPPRREVADESFRDDVGCVTWLIGSAILIGLLGLVILGFRLGDLSIFDTQVEPTPTEAVGEAQTPTTTTPSPTATTEPAETPTSTASPEPSPTATPEMARVPSLVSSTVDQARLAAQVCECTLVVEEVFSDEYAAERVITQDPPAEELVEMGTEIRVQVSKGPEFVTVPEVAGLSVDEATTSIENEGLTAEVIEEPSQEVAEGLIIRAEPNDQVENGGTVTLYVSVGNKVQVPDVFQKPHLDAVKELSDAGLVVNSAMPQSCEYIRENWPEFDCENFPDGGVVSGTLEWRSWVEPGTRIDIAYYDADLE